jgi:hypothetical protein
MTMRKNVIAAAETAHVLRQKLGSGRNYDDMLSDMRRERPTTLEGEVLLPFTRIGKGSYAPPAYCPGEVLRFCEAVLLKMGSPIESKVSVIEIEFDPAVLALRWEHRRAKQVESL